MNIRRMFDREGGDPTEPHEWGERMDSLLVADPRELICFVADAILALTAAAGRERLGDIARVAPWERS